MREDRTGEEVPVGDDEALGQAEEGGAFRLLFVCSGNTCRSPLAEALARQIAQEEGWASVLAVGSAGTGAYPGAPASEGSRRAAQRHGLDLSEHEARVLDLESVRESDLVLVMSPHHLSMVETFGGEGRSALLSAFAQGSNDPLGGPPVRDPFGGDDDVYEETYRELEVLVREAMDRLRTIVSP